MGLRCTHLVSTKKGEVDFFGRNTTRQSGGGEEGGSGSGVELDDDGWEKWPDETFEERERERVQEEEELHRHSLPSPASDDANDPPPSAQPPPPPPVYAPDGAPTDYRRYGNGFAWRSILESEAASLKAEEEAKRLPESEQWICPVCAVPQPADEGKLDEHLDGCLSRRAIREIVGTAGGEEEGRGTGSGKRKRGRGEGAGKSGLEGGGGRRKAFFA